MKDKVTGKQLLNELGTFVLDLGTYLYYLGKTAYAKIKSAVKKRSDKSAVDAPKNGVLVCE